MLTFSHRTNNFWVFAWSFAGSTQYFCFSVLPFRLSSACYCFTKLLRPLLKRWRFMSHNCFVYLDGDGISGSCDHISAKAVSSIQRSDLASAGFVTNEEKSHREPMQVGESGLGFLINTILGLLSKFLRRKLRTSEVRLSYCLTTAIRPTVLWLV